MALVAILGRPNTGKSTLFNRIAGPKKALVDNLPGVTRDLHYADVTVLGRHFILVDTGGLSLETQDTLIERVTEQVEFAVQEADAIIFLMDGRDGLSPEDEDIADKLRKTEKRVHFVVNKVESPKQREAATEFYRLGMEKLHLISAREGLGVSDLFEDVLSKLPEDEQENDESDGPGGEVRVAIVGKPNVGKSSLVNRLIGQERMIVDPTPGTTRDAIDIPFTYNEKPYLLIDTAGIRRKARVSFKLEKFSVVKALKALDRCHIALVLGDATETFSDQMLRITSYGLERGRGVIWIFNKMDLVENIEEWRREISRQRDLRLRHLDFIPMLEISAKTGRGQKNIFPLLERVTVAHNRRIETGPLNRFIERAVSKHPPPIAGNRPLKFFFTTQPSVRPPKFLLFTNSPKDVHFSYRRYLLRTIREHSDYTGTPIRLVFKKRSGDGSEHPRGKRK